MLSSVIQKSVMSLASEMTLFTTCASKPFFKIHAGVLDPSASQSCDCSVSTVSTVNVKVVIRSNQISYLLEQQDVSLVILFTFASSDLSAHVIDASPGALLSKSIDESRHIFTMIQAHDDPHSLLIVEKRQIAHSLLNVKVDRFLGKSQDCSFRRAIELVKISRL